MYELLTIGLIVIIGGCGWSSYKIGRKDGAESLLEILHKQKIIAYDEKGNVRPNPFYEEPAQGPWQD